MDNKIKSYAHRKGIRQYQLADRLGIQESRLSKMLRYPLSKDDTEKMIAIINEMANERDKEDNQNG